jgi:plastocyanin
LIWVLRAVLGSSLLVLLVLASRLNQEQPSEITTFAAASTATATPRPSSTPETLISRIARTTPTTTQRPTSADSGSPSVSVIDNGFDPPELRVSDGQSVTWRNEGAATHDISSLGAEEWVSGPLLPAHAFRRVFAAPGRYEYYCSLHPTMRGRIVVQAS